VVVAHVRVAEGGQPAGGDAGVLARPARAVDDDLGVPVGQELRGEGVDLVVGDVDRPRQVLVLVVHRRQRLDQRDGVAAPEAGAELVERDDAGHVVLPP
jgi:hypothetical protein